MQRWRSLATAGNNLIHKIVFNCNIACSRYRDVMTIVIALENSFQRELPKKLRFDLNASKIGLCNFQKPHRNVTTSNNLNHLTAFASHVREREKGI